MSWRQESRPTNFQWDDPYNQVLNFDPDPIFTEMAVYTNMPITFVTPSLTAGQNYVITVTADEGSSFDAIVTIKDPNGNIIVNNQDTGTDETINLFPPITGVYSIIVTNFGGTTGAFTVNVYNGDNPQITTDFNLLASTWKAIICRVVHLPPITSRPTFRSSSV